MHAGAVPPSLDANTDGLPPNSKQPRMAPSTRRAVHRRAERGGRRLHSFLGSHRPPTVPEQTLTIGERWRRADVGRAGSRSLRRHAGGSEQQGGRSMKDITETKIRSAVMMITLTVFIFAMVWFVVVGAYALR